MPDRFKVVCIPYWCSAFLTKTTHSFFDPTDPYSTVNSVVLKLSVFVVFVNLRGSSVVSVHLTVALISVLPDLDISTNCVKSNCLMYYLVTCPHVRFMLNV